MSTGVRSMGFQIDSEEFEVAEDNKKREIRFEIADVLRKIVFIKERYEERVKAIERRRKNLLRTVKVFVGIAIAFFLLAMILLLAVQGNEGIVFGIWAIIMFVIFSIIIIVNAARAVWSYCVHNGLIANKSIYTLKMEEQDLLHFKKRLEQAEEQLKQFAGQEECEEEAGRLLLAEVLPQLQEEERRADYLYGETTRIP